VSAIDSKRIEHLLRELAPQVLGAVVRRFGDFAAAEDAVQEALLAGATQWPRTGLPDNPRGWLIHVAARRMTDAIRSDVARREREATLARQEWPFHDPASVETDAGFADDTLTLLFMCCHPALTSPSAIALTLRAIGGLTTAEIAQAFLVPEATLAQRISRAKQTIRQSGIPFEQPDSSGRGERLASVLHVLYLVFNEGYTSSGGAALHRADLSDEAIRLARAVHALLPDEAEVAGLLALMLLTDARRAARTDASGSIVPLPKQDRARWNRGMIDEGLALVAATLPKGRVGPYQIQAAIAALHDEAERAEDTDWPQIVALYEVLLRLSDNPVIALNHAVAAAMVHGPRAGLALVDAIANGGRLAASHRVDSVRAHLLELAGEHQAAIASYLAAASRTASVPERNYLATEAARLRAEN
jgi:RNA polymerase sigma factor (sigma-70 family)